MKQALKKLIGDRMCVWTLDNDGDLTLSVCNLLHITFYKWNDSSVVRFGRRDYRPAPKSLWRVMVNHTNTADPDECRVSYENFERKDAN
jgi:hypothetical protein